MLKKLIALALILLAPLAAMAEEGAIAPEAKALFAQYEQLNASFDMGLLDLYADDADIQGWHTGPDGRVAKMKYTADQQSEMYRQMAPEMKKSGGTIAFTNVAYKPEKEGVRVTANMAGMMMGKPYSGKVSLLLKPQANDRWLIAQELSYTK